MEKKDLYDGFVDLEQETQGMLDKLAAFKNKMAELVAQNAELEIENQHLREHLKALQGSADHKSNGANELSKSRQNLEKLYYEGFHVCPYDYGKRRKNNEPCAFCQTIIYGEH